MWLVFQSCLTFVHGFWIQYKHRSSGFYVQKMKHLAIIEETSRSKCQNSHMFFITPNEGLFSTYRMFHVNISYRFGGDRRSKWYKYRKNRVLRRHIIYMATCCVFCYLMLLVMFFEKAKLHFFRRLRRRF